MCTQNMLSILIMTGNCHCVVTRVLEYLTQISCLKITQLIGAIINNSRTWFITYQPAHACVRHTNTAVLARHYLLKSCQDNLNMQLYMQLNLFVHACWQSSLSTNISRSEQMLCYVNNSTTLYHFILAHHSLEREVWHRYHFWEYIKESSYQFSKAGLFPIFKLRQDLILSSIKHMCLNFNVSTYNLYLLVLKHTRKIYRYSAIGLNCEQNVAIWYILLQYYNGSPSWYSYPCNLF